MNCKIWLFPKFFNFPFSLNQQSQCNTLHTSS